MTPSIFDLYRDMFTLNLQTGKMLASSGEVIFKRSMMIQQAMMGNRSWTDPEFTKLWQEKIFANMEAGQSMGKSMMKKALSQKPSTAGRDLSDGIRAVTASTRPYEKKASANARRLRGR